MAAVWKLHWRLRVDSASSRDCPDRRHRPRTDVRRSMGDRSRAVIHRVAHLCFFGGHFYAKYLL